MPRPEAKPCAAMKGRRDDSRFFHSKALAKCFFSVTRPPREEANPAGRGLGRLPRRVHSDPVMAKLPVIAVSAYTDGDYEQRALRSACAAALREPCTPTEVTRQLHRFLP